MQYAFKSGFYRERCLNSVKKFISKTNEAFAEDTNESIRRE